MEHNNTTNIGVLDLLCLLFIGLKLCGVITWSWLWILAPEWIPILFATVNYAISKIK